MDAIIAMALKDLRLLVRDKLGFFFSFVFPLIVAIFFGGVMSSGGGGGDGPRGIKVVLVDEDGTEQSKAFAADLAKAEELTVRTEASRDRGAELVRTGAMTAAIVLPKGFGERRENPFGGDPATIELGVDPSRRAEAGMLQGLLTKYAFVGFTRSFTDPATVKRQTDLALESMRKSEDLSAVDRAVFETFFASLRTFVGRMPAKGADAGDDPAGQPAAGPAAEFSPIRIDSFPVIRQRRGPENSFAITFPQGIVWGVMGCAYGFAVTLSLERARGTLLRLRAAPLARWGVVGGKALACFLAVCGVCVVLLIIAAVGFGVRPTSVPLLIAAVASTGVCFVGVMMALAVLGGRSDSSGNLGWAVLLVMAMLGGGMIPLLFMPPWMQSVSVVSPVRWSILALEGALWRGFTAREMLVPCVVLCGIGTACFALGTRMFRWTEEG